MRFVSAGEFRWLDFDCESRPLTFLGDWNTSEITAIAAGWIGQKEVKCWALGQVSSEEMLTEFRAMYDLADGVTGHNIRRFDLPLVNGALVEHGFGPLAPKLTCDTYGDFTKRKDLSASQESLAQMLGSDKGKPHMTQPDWREANRLTEDGIERTRKRVIGDVRQHKELRAVLLERGLLKAPKTWGP